MGTGKKKIEIRKVENLKYRRVTFCKRRQGLFKKADQISRITGCRVAVLVFSPAMKPFLHGDVSLLEQVADKHHTLGDPNTTTAATTDSGSPRVGRGDGDDDLQRHSTDEELMNNNDDTRPLQIVPASSSSTPHQHYPPHSLLSPGLGRSSSSNTNNLNQKDDAARQLNLAELLSGSEINLKPDDGDGGCMEEKDLDQLVLMKQRLEVLRERVLHKLMASDSQSIITPAAAARCFPSN